MLLKLSVCHSFFSNCCSHSDEQCGEKYENNYDASAAFKKHAPYFLILLSTRRPADQQTYETNYDIVTTTTVAAVTTTTAAATTAAINTATVAATTTIATIAATTAAITIKTTC